jgi:alpha-D-ribose 1-methylphosphonate 5-triphosphate synthase subunit PhnL
VACLTVLTGVSGSGKSSLMHGCIAPAARAQGKKTSVNANYIKAKGFERIESVYEVDQSPIGFNKYILNDVANINPLHQSLIQPERDHSAQRIAMPIEQFLDRLRLSISDIYQ